MNYHTIVKVWLKLVVRSYCPWFVFGIIDSIIKVL